MRHWLWCATWLSIVGPVASAAEPPTEGLAFFEREIRPLLSVHCDKCHGEGKSKGGLSLAGRATLLVGGESGPAVDLEHPEKSLLLEALNYTGLEMPPSGKLKPAEIAVFEKWIRLGAPMPEGPPPVKTGHGVPQVNDETKNHWAFRRIERPAIPDVEQRGWVTNPIDAFILSKLEAADLAPNLPAAPQQLIRRLHYDLVGLPPSAKLVELFVSDPSPISYAKIAKDLLDAPQHGEHYARYWLDLVRYGETNSYERDDPKPFVWRYRDYVINFFNSERGYDEFVREQLAGDELSARRRLIRANPTTDETGTENLASGRKGASSLSDAELLIATGYYRLGLWDDEPVDQQAAFFDGLDDLVSTTSQSFLALTLNCARCHDHKLDPLPQADYYRFAAFFRNIRHYGRRSHESVLEASVRSIATPEEEQAFAAEKQAWEARVRALREQLDAVEVRVKPHLKGGEKDDFERDSERLRVIRAHRDDVYTAEEIEAYARVRKEWTDLRNRPPRSAQQALCVTENGPQAPPTHILIRGSAQAEGDVVEPAFPAVLSPPQPDIEPLRDTTGRRTALAEWLVSRENPLTARVIANRMWQWHFGRGLVESANDFGLQGTPPTHPELLDWLAAELMDHGWSLRHLHRLILSSSTYRMSSAPRAEALAIDPENRLFWRFDMRRLRAEEVRDSILAVNGSLNLSKMYGPSIYPFIEKEVLAGQSQPGRGWGQSSPEDVNRRSIYIHIKRSLAVPLLANFDVAEADVTCPVRFATTQPTQALTMLNSAFLQEQSAKFARSLQEAAAGNPTGQLALGLRRVLQREPTVAEIQRAQTLWTSLERDHQLTSDAALKYVCLALLNLNEFVYLD